VLCGAWPIVGPPTSRKKALSNTRNAKTLIRSPGIAATPMLRVKLRVHNASSLLFWKQNRGSGIGSCEIDVATLYIRFDQCHSNSVAYIESLLAALQESF
jgi:hypothetical protein